MGASRPEEKAKEKEKNKANANPFEDALTIEDMVSKFIVLRHTTKPLIGQESLMTPI